MRFNLETERLILRTITPDDWQAAFRWCGDPDVNRFMIYPLYTKAEDVKTLWLDNLDPDDPDSYEAGIVLKENGELIGSAGMYYKPEEDLWTIGYNLRKDQWGHGYAVETMRGLLEHVWINLLNNALKFTPESSMRPMICASMPNDFEISMTF